MSVKHNALWLGLTGGIGCGKTTVAAALREMGATVIDADEISRQLTAPGGAALEEIRARFGDDLFAADGSLERRKLGEIVFSDPEARKALEEILHPAVQREMLRRLDEAETGGAPVSVLDVPLLYECGLDALCDQVWVVAASEEQQILRVMKRDGISKEQVLARIASQMPLAEKKARADRVIDNSGSEADVRNTIKRLYKELTRRKQNA